MLSSPINKDDAVLSSQTLSQLCRRNDTADTATKNDNASRHGYQPSLVSRFLTSRLAKVLNNLEELIAGDLSSGVALLRYMTRVQ